MFPTPSIIDCCDETVARRPSSATLVEIAAESQRLISEDNPIPLKRKRKPKVPFEESSKKTILPCSTPRKTNSRGRGRGRGTRGYGRGRGKIEAPIADMVPMIGTSKQKDETEGMEDFTHLQGCGSWPNAAARSQ